MIHLRGKRTIAYALIIFTLFVGMCFGYVVADSVSVCAKTLDTVSSIRSISGLSHGPEVCAQDDSRTAGQASYKAGSRRNGECTVFVGYSNLHINDLLEHFQIHSMRTMAEEHAGTFSNEGIVRYLHQVDGEKDI